MTALSRLRITPELLQTRIIEGQAKQAPRCGIVDFLPYRILATHSHYAELPLFPVLSGVFLKPALCPPPSKTPLCASIPSTCQLYGHYEAAVIAEPAIRHYVGTSFHGCAYRLCFRCSLVQRWLLPHRSFSLPRKLPYNVLPRHIITVVPCNALSLAGHHARIPSSGCGASSMNARFHALPPACGNLARFCRDCSGPGVIQWSESNWKSSRELAGVPLPGKS